MTPAEWEDALARLCLDRDGGEIAHTLPGDPARWLLYRDMVRTRMVRESGEALRRTRASMSAAQWEALVSEALAERVSQSRFFRDLPLSVATWLRGRAGVDAFLLDVDVAAIEVRDDAIDDGERAAVMSLDGRCCPAPTAQLVRHDCRAAIVWRSVSTLRAHVVEVPAWLAEWFRAWKEQPDAAAAQLATMVAAFGEAESRERLETWAAVMETVIREGGIVVRRFAES